MVTINIRRCTVCESDIEALRNIGIETFIETFGEQNSKSDMSEYLEENFSRKRVAEELSNAESEFWLAYLEQAVKKPAFRTGCAGGSEPTLSSPSEPAVPEDTPCAWLKLNFGSAQTERSYDNSVELQRIYVLKKYKGAGIGTALLERTIQSGHERGAEYVWLGVWEQNLPAQKFYARHGFTKIGEHIFQLGSDAQTDWILSKSIVD